MRTIGHTTIKRRPCPQQGLAARACWSVYDWFFNSVLCGYCRGILPL